MDSTYLDWDWMPVNRSRDFLKANPKDSIEDIDWLELERAFRLDCIDDIGGNTALEISMARSLLNSDHERLEDLLKVTYPEVWSPVVFYAIRTLRLKLDLEFKEEEKHLMKVKLKAVDSAIRTEKSALQRYADQYAYVSEQAHTEALNFGKDVIDLQRDVIGPIKQRTGVDLLERYPLKTPFSDLSQSFERKVIYELGRGLDPFYKPISYLRWHHGFKYGAQPKVEEDPVTGFVQGKDLFDPEDELKIWMYDKSRLPILLDRLEHAIKTNRL